LKTKLASVVVLALAVAPLRADLIYQSATPGGGPGGTNYLVASSQFLGVRFNVLSPVVTTDIGGVFNGISPGGLFGAVVELSGPGGVPASTDLSSPDVLGAAVITPTGSVTGDKATLSLALKPGWYALVYGSGKFGATGVNSAPNTNTDVNSPSYFFYSSGNSGWSEDSFSHTRFFLEGNAVPEPTSLILTSVGAITIALVSWRRRKRAI